MPVIGPSSEGWALCATAVTAEPDTSTAIFELDIDGLAALEPDVILTQATCDVCAIAGDDVVAAVRQAGHPVRVLHLSATSLAGLWADIVTVGRETGRLAQARELVARLLARCDSVADAVEHFLDWNRLSTAEASRLAGRLFFVSTWTAGRWGRATFRTILDLACRGSPGGNISRAERRALRGASLPGSSGNGDYGRWACPRHAPPRR